MSSLDVHNYRPEPGSDKPGVSSLLSIGPPSVWSFLDAPAPSEQRCLITKVLNVMDASIPSSSTHQVCQQWLRQSLFQLSASVEVSPAELVPAQFELLVKAEVFGPGSRRLSGQDPGRRGSGGGRGGGQLRRCIWTSTRIRYNSALIQILTFCLIQKKNESILSHFTHRKHFFTPSVYSTYLPVSIFPNQKILNTLAKDQTKDATDVFKTTQLLFPNT